MTLVIYMSALIFVKQYVRITADNLYVIIIQFSLSGRNNQYY